MSTERDKKEDKTMANTNDARRAHDVLDGLSAGRILSRENEQLLRSFLPELPAQMSLEALRQDVHDVWAGVHGNEWPDDMYCDLETWLAELHAQLKGVGVTAPAHPEFLETEADYTDVPEGTILTMDVLDTAWVKKFDGWVSTETSRERSSKELGYTRRRVLRWGWGK